MAVLDRELDSDVEFSGEAEDAQGRVVDTEKTGGRHRRRYGYTSAGAQENDQDIADKGRKPLRITMHKADPPESRIANFSHGMTTHHVSTVKPQKYLTIIKH